MGKVGVGNSVNDPTTTVHIIDTKEGLLCNLTNEILWDAFLLMTPDQAEEVFTEDFENHAEQQTWVPWRPLW